MSPLSHTSYRTSRHWTKAEALAALEALRASGLSVQDFADQEGIQAQRLYGWRRRLAVERPAPTAFSPTFIELRPRAYVPHMIEVVLRSGHVLRTSDTIEPSLLARLVSALEQAERC